MNNHSCYEATIDLLLATYFVVNKRSLDTVYYHCRRILGDMRIRILEKNYNKDHFYRKKRENMYINKFNTKLKGLNKIS